MYDVHDIQPKLANGGMKVHEIEGGRREAPRSASDA